MRGVKSCGYSSGKSRGGGLGARRKHTGPGMPLYPINGLRKLSTKLVSFTGTDQSIPMALSVGAAEESGSGDQKMQLFIRLGSLASAPPRSHLRRLLPSPSSPTLQFRITTCVVLVV
jgi:hypothetical protein